MPDQAGQHLDGVVASWRDDAECCRNWADFAPRRPARNAGDQHVPDCRHRPADGLDSSEVAATDGARRRRVSPLAAWTGRPSLFPDPHRRGVSLALLGPDGAGKSTLSALLVREWPFGAVPIYMGLWKSGHGTKSVPGLAALLRIPTAWSRYSKGRAAQAYGCAVIYDRYVYDAMRPPKPPLVRTKRAYFWLLAHCVPRPDLIVLLDAPGSVSMSRKGEHSVEEGDRARQEYLELAARLGDVLVLDATADPQTLTDTIMDAMRRRQPGRWADAGSDWAAGVPEA